jgi:hypothetical protein
MMGLLGMRSKRKTHTKKKLALTISQAPRILRLSSSAITNRQRPILQYLRRDHVERNASRRGREEGVKIYDCILMKPGTRTRAQCSTNFGHGNNLLLEKKSGKAKKIQTAEVDGPRRLQFR